jgi:hypothetical protein
MRRIYYGKRHSSPGKKAENPAHQVQEVRKALIPHQEEGLLFLRLR